MDWFGLESKFFFFFPQRKVLRDLNDKEAKSTMVKKLRNHIREEFWSRDSVLNELF